MKAPTEKELRNLALLEQRLAKAQAEKATLTAEKRELKQHLTVAEKKAQEAERQRQSEQESRLAALSNAAHQVREIEQKMQAQATQITALLAENRRLAESLEASLAEAEQLQAVAANFSAEAKTAKAESAAAKQAKEKSDSALKESETARNVLQSRLTAAEAQLKEKRIPPILPAEEVAQLFGALLENIRSGLGGVSVRSGEVKLKVAFSGAGSVRGFVVPTPQASPDLKENLHEIIIRFDQPLVTGAQTPPLTPPITRPPVSSSRTSSARKKKA
jgi:hypothetical protein